MNNKSFFSFAGSLVLGLVSFGSTLYAGSVQYQVSVNTSDFVGTVGFIDLQFNQSDAIGALSGVASIDGFNSTGYTFNSSQDVNSGAGIGGSFTTPPLTIQNDQNAANYFARGVGAFGTGFSFTVTFSGPIVGGTATNPSDFFVIPEDSTGAPLFNLGGAGGTVGDITFNNDGTSTPTGSSLASVSLISSVPEPSGLLTGLGGLLAIAGWLLKNRRNFS